MQRNPHAELEKNIRALGNKVESGGVCSSVTLTGIKSFLANPQAFDTFKEMIESAVQEQDESIINEPLAEYLHLLSIIQLPHYHPEIFHQPYTTQTSDKVIEFLNKNYLSDEANEIGEAYRFPIITHFEGMLEIVKLIKYYADTYELSLGVYLGSADHAIALCYSKDTFEILNMNTHPFQQENLSLAVTEAFYGFVNESEEGSEEESEEEFEDKEPLGYRTDDEDVIVENTSEESFLKRKGKEEISNEAIPVGANDLLEDAIVPLEKVENRNEKNQGINIAIEMIFYVRKDNLSTAKVMFANLSAEETLNNLLLLPQENVNDKQSNALNLMVDKIKNLKGEDQLSLAHLAAKFDHPNIIKKLGERKANLNIALKSNGNTPAYLAAQEGHLNAVKMITKFIKVNELDIPNAMGYTPLAVAAQWGHKEIVNFLLGLGCDLESQDPTNPSPLFAAMLGKRYDIIEILLDSGADMQRQIVKNVQLFPLFARQYGIPIDKAQDFIASCNRQPFSINPIEFAELLGDKIILGLFTKCKSAHSQQTLTDQEGHNKRLKLEEEPRLNTNLFGPLRPSVGQQGPKADLFHKRPSKA